VLKNHVHGTMAKRVASYRSGSWNDAQYPETIS
jgi:hypothetical protein